MEAIRKDSDLKKNCLNSGQLFNPSIFIYLQLCLKAQEPKLKHLSWSLKCYTMIHIVLFTEIPFNVFLFHSTDLHPANNNRELLLPPSSSSGDRDSLQSSLNTLLQTECVEEVYRNNNVNTPLSKISEPALSSA